MTKAEVNQLAGARDRAAVSLRAALRIYQDRHVAPLIDQVTAALASLTDHPAPSRPNPGRSGGLSRMGDCCRSPV
jgi:hypothetical protein